jgi:hypothetical protein
VVERSAASRGVLVQGAGAVAVCVVVAAGLAPLTEGAGPFVVLVAGLGVLLATAVWLHPPLAAYVLIVVTPLTAGIERGVVVPYARPSEAVAVLLAGVLVARHLVAVYLGRVRLVRLRAMDVAVAGIILTASVLPLLWLVARGRTGDPEDVLYALYPARILLDYVVIRVGVSNAPEVRRCLWLALASGCVIALLAILQSLNVLGVGGLLNTVFPVEEGAVASAGDRATTTLGSSIATGALMVYTVGVALAWWLGKGAAPRLLTFAVPLLTFAVLASGQFSTAFGLLVCVVTVGLLLRRLTHVTLSAVPLLVVGGLLLSPVIVRRLDGFDRPDGLPQSWVGRWNNLRTFFWPELFSNWNFVLGVKPAARVPATDSWRDFVYIESGHTWLLWTGGLPLLLAFCAFSWVGLRTTARVARIRTDAIGTAAAAAFTGLVVMNVLMILDPHLTLRGSSDLLLVLVALATTRTSVPGPPSPPRMTSQTASERGGIGS